MRKLFFIFIAVCFSVGMAQAGQKPPKPKKQHQAVAKHLSVTGPRSTTFLNVLAKVPGAGLKILTVGTDTAEYIAGKVSYYFMEIDTAADAAETYLSNVH